MKPRALSFILRRDGRYAIVAPERRQHEPAGSFFDEGAVPVADSKDPQGVDHPDNPDELPVLTDVMVPGRPPMRWAAPHEAAPAPEREEFAAPAGAELQGSASIESPMHAEPEPLAAPIHDAPAERAAGESSAAPTQPMATADVADVIDAAQAAQAAQAAGAVKGVEGVDAELTEHDAEQLAERLRVRFAGYLREEGRGVIEARCRAALEEHTNWLVRQVTREVALALEGEVVGWVRDAVREELAAHRVRRR